MNGMPVNEVLVQKSPRPIELKMADDVGTTQECKMAQKFSFAFSNLKMYNKYKM